MTDNEFLTRHIWNRTASTCVAAGVVGIIGQYLAEPLIAAASYCVGTIGAALFFERKFGKMDEAEAEVEDTRRPLSQGSGHGTLPKQLNRIADALTEAVDAGEAGVPIEMRLTATPDVMAQMAEALRKHADTF